MNVEQEEAAACEEYHNDAAITISLPREGSDACPVVDGDGLDDNDVEKKRQKERSNLSKKATDLSCVVSRAALGDVSNLESINRNCSSNDLRVSDQGNEENHEASTCGTEDRRQASPKVANVVPSELPIAIVVHISLQIDPQTGKPTLRLTLHAPGDAGKCLYPPS